MAKSATLKDVLYALEFAGARLCRWPTAKPNSTAAWSLEPGGVKVPSHVADQARGSGNLVKSGSSRFGEDIFVWAHAA